MDFISVVQNLLRKLSPRVISLLEFFLKIFPIEKFLLKIPSMKKKVDEEVQAIVKKSTHSLKPYQNEIPCYKKIPEEKISHEEILTFMKTMTEHETSWQKGFASGAVYHGEKKHLDFLNQVYALNSQTNPIHFDLWPSAPKFESEIVSMTARMLGKKEDDEICGTISSGGTESILLAIKSYRDYAKDQRGINKPELIVPISAHVAFDKACEYFGIKKVAIPLNKHYQVDLKKVKQAITSNTIALVGSAPSFPHGIIDPIEDLAFLAKKYGLGMHTDACLGGFVLPWIPAHIKVPRFDFNVEGVTSISVDTHKFGYTNKGTSVILYRYETLRHYQYFTACDWPGGLYFSPTLAGSRPGALSAQCWATLLSIGQSGYRESVARILATATFIKDEIAKIPGMYILGNPLWVIAFSSDDLNIYEVLDLMTKKGWSLNGLHRPACIHICLTLKHTETGIAERFVQDLTNAVLDLRKLGLLEKGEKKKEGMAPVYGIAGTLPTRSIVKKVLVKYVDTLFEP